MRLFFPLGGLRSRLILIAIASVSVGLVAGGVVLVATLQVAVQRTVDEGALQTARTVRALVDAGQLPDPIPAVGAQSAVVQVIDANGRVRAASGGSDRLVSLLRPPELAEVRSGKRIFVRGDRAGLDGPLRVVGLPAGSRADPRTVVVAAPISQLQSSTRVLRGALFIFFPILSGVLAIVSFWVIGRTLRPVEALRRGAEEITGSGSATLLPVPKPPDEIHRLAVTLNDMLTRLEKSRRRQRAFVADAAHELRSPLASMRTQLEVAQHLGDRADWPATASDLLIDLDRLTRLTSDLLLLARADDSRPLPVSPEPVELTALVRDLACRYADARIVPSVDAGDPVWTVGEPDAIRRIVANLLDNAVRHAASSVTVAVSAADMAVITVTDDGAGIPEADRERVFGRFTRLDDARSHDDGGSGLGLAIVRELLRRHRGQVELRDADPGVRAEVRLPLRERISGEV